jgi:phospholipid transport system substrate-binding protein
MRDDLINMRESNLKLLNSVLCRTSRLLVRSQLIKSDGGIVNFDYVLHQTEGKWRITNILFDGVSDLAIKRGEYRAIMQRDGFQAH